MLRVPESGDDHFSLTAGPLRVSVSESGVLRIGWDEPDWFGPARLLSAGSEAPRPVSSSRTEVTIAAGDVAARVRAVSDEPVVVLRLEAPSGGRGLGTGAFASPSVAWHFDPAARDDGGAPESMRAFGHQYTEFALPVFSDAAMSRWRLLPFRPPIVMPLGVVAPDGRTILLAPLSSFHELVIVVPAGTDDAAKGLLAGWHGDIDEVDAGFATELAVIAGDGARDCYDRWARLLRAASGVAPPPRDADTLGTRVSYWTDNGSAYWYRTEPGHDAASTIVAAVDDLEARGVPVGAVQLDSWWYPHEVLRPFDTDEWEVPPTGMIRWAPRDDVLPDGIEALRERLGRRPLVTHCRHLSARSPYTHEFPAWVDGDRAHPATAEMYERLLDQAVGWGVEVFEHDWLIECFLGVRELRAPGRAARWQEGIDAGLTARNLHAQWCMASPADFAQTSRLNRVTSIRTSGDHGYLVGPGVLWAWFLHNNMMARALGLWPYKDVFHSAHGSETREVEALLAALSAGPVGIGDRVGRADPDLIRRTCRADGVLVRPDVPIAAIDRAAFDAPVWSGEPIVASTHTQHSAGRWGYAVVCNVGIEPAVRAARVDLPGLGSDRPDAREVALYDWRTGSIDVMPRDGSYEVMLDPAGWDFRVIVPVLRGGLAVVGDPALYACGGDTRIADVAAAGDGVDVTVLGAGEPVRLIGTAPRPVSARILAPAADAAVVTDYDADRSAWELELEVDAAGWTKIRIELEPDAGGAM